MSDDTSLIAALDLEALLLHESHVVRGDAENTEPGEVRSKLTVEFSRQQDLVYYVRSTNEFMNVDDELLAEIEVTFAATYAYEGPEPTEGTVAEYAEGPLMLQVLPFVREFLASMTNRLGIAAYYLPIFKEEADLLSAEELGA